MQGPHLVAQKSITTTLPFRRLSEMLSLGEIGAANRDALPPTAVTTLGEARARSGDPDLQRAAAAALARLASSLS